MSHPLVDLLWRDYAPPPGTRRRGPRSRLSTGDVVGAAIDIADDAGLSAVRMRAVAHALATSPMSLYTHVNSREDLVVLMADAAYGAMDRPAYADADWRARIRGVAEDNLAGYLARPWLLEVADDRVALGPGTIAKYDHELHAFDGAGLSDVERDAALTFVLDFVRASATNARGQQDAQRSLAFWEESAPRLATYLDGPEHALARRVGQAAGEHQQAAYSPTHAYAFGIERIVTSLVDLAGGTAT